MIILGYQGIGKSTTAIQCMSAIDLESSNFYISGVRDSNWARIYCNIAESLTKQHNDVFVSTHRVVRDTLAHDIHAGAISPQEIAMICPGHSIKDEWIARLEQRYEESQLDKDFRALMNAKDRFDENIAELQEFATKNKTNYYIIDSMNYDLAYIIHYIKLHNSAARRE